MKIRYDIFGCLVALLGVMTGLYSCVDDELEGIGNATIRPSDVICFSPSLSNSRTASVSRGSSGHLEIEQEEWLVGMEMKQSDSRGKPVTLLKGSAGVIGYVYDTWSDTDTKPCSPTMYNKEFKFDGDELTAASADVRWNKMIKKPTTDPNYDADDPNYNNVKFFVYAPYGMSGADLSDSNQGGVPTLAYEVEADKTKQHDLIVASWTGAEGTNYGTNSAGKVIQPQSIPLMFEHVLTAVKFNIGFECTVIKLEVKGIYNSGVYTFDKGWAVTTSGDGCTSDYTFNFGEKNADGITYKGQAFKAKDALTQADSTLMMIPQTLGPDAEVILTYKEGSETTSKTVTSELTNKVWQEGKMITYTIHKTEAPTTIYFDLAAGNVELGRVATSDDVSKYKNTYISDLENGNIIYVGSVYVGGDAKVVVGKHDPKNRYYVYQSSTDSNFPDFTAAKTGYEDINYYNNKTNCRIPDYLPVECNNEKWSDFITNNDNVESVIEAWYEGMANTDENKRAKLKGRTGTKNNITVNPVNNTSFDLVIDDIYSTFQTADKSRKNGGITFAPETTQKCVLTITTLGDNRLGNIHYYNRPNEFKQPHLVNNMDDIGLDGYIDTFNKDNGSKIIFEGTGSLAVADVIATKNSGPGWTGKGYFANHYCSAIGGNDDGTREQSMGIVINSGVLFAGSTAAENCSAIGGGGNGFGEVTINGGIVTAVASTTGTAIGGGIGYSSNGGEGRVYINGGNVYAYNLDNKRNIPSSAIGGAGSSNSTGTLGVVEINGGYVYAYSALGTAIGGGSSENNVGGDAKVTIRGGQVIAKSGIGAGIGGGSAYTKKGSTGKKYNGGTAKIQVSGNPIIRTGSIGGGLTGDTSGKIGSAEITIDGGDIQAQFVMAAGAKATPTFTMTDGTIRNSNVDDKEYIHIQKKGGAVYLEDGKFEMTGGIIKNCSAIQGGAVYIERQSTEPMDEDDFNFKMTGGEIHSCFSTGGTITEIIDEVETDSTYLGHGGAVCLNGGQIQMIGGKIWNNYSVDGDGGAIYISNGNFFMKDNDLGDTKYPEISGNSAQKGNGGGVFVASGKNETKVQLLQGVITENTANNYGGGVCVDMKETGQRANVIVGVDGQGVTEADANPVISDNMAMMSGGGLYVRGTNANITINSGMIDGNDVSAYVKNENVANEGGEVTLNKGLVTHIVVTFVGNQGTTEGADPVTTYTQKIVKDTNSKLKANSFIRGGYNFSGWNTRPDGLGDKNYNDKDLINISEDITLYAKWVSQ